jgi:hypothetical protein
MANTVHIEAAAARISPLVLSDRLLTLAQDADRAGLRAAADKLVHLAHAVCDQPIQLHA